MDNEKRDKMRERVKNTDNMLRKALIEVDDYPALLVSTAKLLAVLIDRLERKGKVNAFLEVVSMLTEFRELVKDNETFIQ